MPIMMTPTKLKIKLLSHSSLTLISRLNSIKTLKQIKINSIKIKIITQFKICQIQLIINNKIHNLIMINNKHYKNRRTFKIMY